MDRIRSKTRLRAPVLLTACRQIVGEFSYGVEGEGQQVEGGEGRRRGAACRGRNCVPGCNPWFWKEAHNAQRLTSEVTVVVRYPFHPLVGQTLGVIGSREHGGVRHLVIRRPDGSASLLPEWMTFPQAGAVRIVPCPRLSINRLVELGALIDRLMLLSSGKCVPGGRNDETNATDRTESVRDTVVERTVRISTSEALELLKVLLKEAMSATEAGSKRRDREVGDDQ